HHVLTVSSSLFFHSSRPPPYLHSFPTRRSSDLPRISRRHRHRDLCRRERDAADAEAQRRAARRHHARVRRRCGRSRRALRASGRDRKSTRLNSSHVAISYAVFCLKKKKKKKK